MRKLFGTATILGLVSVCSAVPTMPSLFSDHMVLQKSNDVPVWGTADAGEAITVALVADGKPVVSKGATADAQGKWKVSLDTSNVPDRPLEMTVTGKSTITVHDALVGQVWLCSGQSNMEMTLSRSRDADAEAKAANFPGIRQFMVPRKAAYFPTAELEGRWVVASPETVPSFTAAGYFFGRELHQQLHVPVGLIASSVGGSAAEMWATGASLDAIKDFDQQREMASRVGQNLESAREGYQRDLAAWAGKLPMHADPALAKQYADPAFDSSSWKTVELPQQIEKTDPDFDGALWYRREINLENADGPAEINLGMIDDHDVTYINGVKVGGIGLEDSSAWCAQRHYKIAPGVLKAGRNVIAIRVFDIWLAGGIMVNPQEFFLEVGQKRHNLSGTWQVKVEHALTAEEKAIAAQRPADPDNSVNIPSMHYNAMIYPLQPYAIAGVIWYQGEANVNRAEQYGRLLPAMIQGWRTAWNQQSKPAIAREAGHDFPFYIVQIANYMDYRRDPNFNAQWAAIRDVQTHVARTVPNAGLAVTIDIGEAGDIHPKNKQDVGKRLAAVALKNAYGKDIVSDGPELEKAKVQDGRVIVSFAHADGGLQVHPLTSQDGEVFDELAKADTQVKGFAICGEDGKWVWAKAKITSPTTIEVWNDTVAKPTGVYYGEADNPVVNLYNGAGLPAVPFRVKF